MHCYPICAWEDSFLIVIRLSLCWWRVSIWELFLTEAVPGVWPLAWRWASALCSTRCSLCASGQGTSTLCTSVSGHEMGMLTSASLTGGLGVQGSEGLNAQRVLKEGSPFLRQAGSSTHEPGQAWISLIPQIHHFQVLASAPQQSSS